MIETEEVLECDGSKGLGLVIYLYAFLCLDSLVETIIIAAAHHKTACELVNDNDLALVYNVVDILLHNAVCLDSLVDMVKKCGVLSVVQVHDIEVFLSLLNALTGDSGCLCLFVDDVVAVLCNLFLIGLCVHFGNNKGLQGLGKLVCHGVHLGGLVASARNDKRSSRFINKDRIDLIDDSKVEFSLNLFVLVDHHVVTEVVETELIVGSVSNIAVVCLTALVVVHVVEDTADSKT